jgi:UDP-2,4-diacetamido-2,4,6-trideoxy-beta-L-altropyranose hydrolase
MNLLFRTDASVTMGTGHVMRCIALAQAVQDAGGSAVFAMAATTAGVQARLAAESCDLLFLPCDGRSDEDAQQTISLARERAVDWIVVDGYQFTADYQQALKAAGSKIVFVDDYGHAAHYPADLVLNQNAYADEKLYAAREPYTRLLLGSDYCLLRREFISWRGWKRVIAPVGNKILVTMGGSDPENFTAVVIEGLRQLNNVATTVVVGGSNPHFESLQRMVLQSGEQFRLMTSVANMADLMAWADLAVSGAGSTCWEMCLLQLPMMLIDLADNQKPIAHVLEASGAAVHLGTYPESQVKTQLGSAGVVTGKKIAERVSNLLASETERSALSARCGKLVDGRGAERVCSELLLGKPRRG